MKKLPLILIGGGGHCKSCIDVIHKQDKYAIKGIIDANEPTGKTICGYIVLGNDSALPALIKEDNYFLITIGQIKSSALREKIYDELNQAGAKMATVVSPIAYVSPDATIGDGSIVLHGAMINAAVVTGVNCIINSMALLEHDAKIGNHVHVSTGALINGDCSVANNCFIGSGAVMVNSTKISDEVVIGAGSVVTKNITSPGIYAGNPAKRISNE